MTAVKYEFDTDFQTKIAACVLKDSTFNNRTTGLIKPEYFENLAEAALVNIATKYHTKFDRMPDYATLISLVKKDIDAKIIRKDMIDDVKNSVMSLREEDIGDVEYVVEEVAEFAKHQAVESAILKSVEHLEKRDFAKIEKLMNEATQVGANEDVSNYDLFAEDSILQREALRNERLAGLTTKSAMSTGVRGLDKRLFHKGWAKKEEYVFMGPPKSGKSTALAYFAKNAAVQGFDVLYITLELSKDMSAERIDACATGIAMTELETHVTEVSDKIRDLRAKAGKLMMEEFPTGTLTPRDVSRVMQKYKSKGITFDQVYVDYMDIMAPNVRSGDAITDSKSIYVDMRALAQIEEVAVISAMQTNREGAKVVTSKMEHAAEDFNKIRIPDLVISINATDEEKARNEARMFFAASRNQAGDFSIHIQQNLEAMQFLTKILKIE